MKLALKYLVAAATAAIALANNGNGNGNGNGNNNTGIPDGEICQVYFDNNQYRTYGEDCTQHSDCVFNVADDGTTPDGLPISGICSPTSCSGSNGNKPLDEGTLRITICHRTCSETNPWVRITIDSSGWGGLDCGHMHHLVWPNITTNNGITACPEGKDFTKWGVNNRDYILKVHGYRADVRAKLEQMHELPAGSLGTNSELEKEYWRFWEPACPYVRNGACCDWFNGNCCGDPPEGTYMKEASAMGDPHIKRWDRKKFQYNGGCDLVFLSTNALQDENGKFDIHIRTAVTSTWSSIDSVAMKSGVFHAQFDADKFYIGGVEKADTDLPYTINNITINEPVELDGVKNYTITLSPLSHSVVSIVGSFVNIIVYGHYYDFHDSVGLVGTFDAGKPYDRSGNRLFGENGLIDFVSAWQVDTSAGDEALFTTSGAAICSNHEIGSATRRRLGDVDPEFRRLAEEACANKGGEYDACMFDVLSTKELALAKLH